MKGLVVEDAVEKARAVGETGASNRGVSLPTPQAVGEVIYPQICRDKRVTDGALAGKITGMILDGVTAEELATIMADSDALSVKISEALSLLEPTVEHRPRRRELCTIAKCIACRGSLGRGSFSVSMWKRAQQKSRKVGPDAVRCIKCTQQADQLDAAAIDKRRKGTRKCSACKEHKGATRQPCRHTL